MTRDDIRGVVAGGQGGMASEHFPNCLSFGNFNVSSENVRFLLLGKIQVSNFIGKSFNLPPYSTGATTPLYDIDMIVLNVD